MKAKRRKRSGSGAKARPDHALCEAHLAEFVKADLKGELLACTADEAAKAQAVLMDGKLLLVTNVPYLTPQEVVRRYKALADIERGFHVLQSEIDMAPVYHRLRQHIRAHAMLCFIVLILHRVMRHRLKLAESEMSSEQAQAQLRRIQHHSVSINRADGRRVHRQRQTGRSAGRIERQEARYQRSDVLAVVAAEGVASKSIKHLQRSVSNPGVRRRGG